MKIRILLSLMTVFVFSLLANTKNTDLMNIKINENVLLKNGFGSLSGKPILNNKSLEEKINLRGEFNVDKNNNASFEFNKLEHEGKIYNLNNAFIKKGRLRNTNITLKKDSNLTVSGGNKEEILNIINAIDKKDHDDRNKKNEDSSKSNFSLGGTNQDGYNNGSSTPFSPSYLEDKENDNNSSNNSNTPTDNNNNSAIVVECPKPSYENGLATYYVQLGTICTKRTANSVETKYNTDSCLNKVDYKNNSIELGYELFANDPEHGTHLVQTCQYKEAIELKSEVSNCPATIDFKNNTALLQKRYFYIFENEKENVGECTPSNEEVSLYYDLNDCDDDRHDFEKNVSVARGQYYYNYDNERIDTGDCVDITKYTYTHYKDSTTCKPKTVGSKIFWEDRVAYNDLIGTQKFATDCAVIDPQGQELLTEFAGYTYSDSAKQAIRRENQFFINPTTNEKIYVNEDVETSNAYPYVESQTRITNNDELRTTTFYKEIYFDDTDENKKVYIQKEHIDRIMPYTLVSSSETGTFIKTLGFKRLNKKADGTYHIYDEVSKVINMTNGNFPVLNGGSTDMTKYASGRCDNFTYTYGAGKKNNTCVGGTQSTTSASYRYWEDQADSCQQRQGNYTKYLCNHFDYWEEIGEYSVSSEYLRGDGTTFIIDSGLIYKIIK